LGPRDDQAGSQRWLSWVQALWAQELTECNGGPVT
jgi:hypothetical protein